MKRACFCKNTNKLEPSLRARRIQNNIMGVASDKSKSNYLRMKPFRILTIALAGMMVIAFYSCDKYYIGDFWFIKKLDFPFGSDGFFIET